MFTSLSNIGAPKYFPESDPLSRNFSRICRIFTGRATTWICVVGSVLFCAASTTYFLYESNQNTKFLHGLAKALPERLGADWTAGTVDGLPAFSGLVFLIARFGHPILFYVIEFGLLACFFWSSFVLVLRLAGNAAQSLAFQSSVAALLVLLIQIHVPFSFVYGVASQYLIGGYLQPSELGVLYVASFALALAGFRNTALIAAAVPAAFHAGYAILSVIIVGSMALSDGMWRRNPVAKIAAVALIVIPQVDLLMRFAPTDYASFREATDILAFERIPQHSQPARWLGMEVYVKLVLVIVGIALAPRGVLRITLAALFVWAVVGTFVVDLTGAGELALVAPWRASIILVSVSTLIILARLGEVFFGSTSFRQGQIAVSALAVFVALLVAGKGLAEKYDDYRNRQVPEYIAFIRDNHKPGDIYLTDPLDERFRLVAMSAQFVSWKTHPYLDREVLEWHSRVELARKVFGDRYGRDTLDCTALTELVRNYRITHILVENRNNPFGENCPPFEVVFSAGGTRVFRMSRTSS